jgi:LacI family transcriptional regulator
VASSGGGRRDGSADHDQHVTIADIAEQAGVSVGTVSNVLNGSARVAPKTEKAVRDAMDRLSYQPNVNARSLRSRVTRTLGLVLPNITNPFYAELAASFGEQAFQFDYELLLCSSGEDPRREELHLATLQQRRVDGAMIVATESSPLHRSAGRMPFPCVFVDRAAVGARSVTTDNWLGGRLAVEHLLGLGHRTIGLAIGDEHVPNIQERLAGARDALDAYGLTVRDEHIIKGPVAVDTGLQGEWLWTMDDPPTAVFATNDVIAIGLWQSCLAAGLDVPGDVSLVGFDDIRWAEFMVPPLTTVHQDIPAMTEHALAMLIQSIAAHELAPREQRVAPWLIVRGSTTSRATGQEFGTDHPKTTRSPAAS